MQENPEIPASVFSCISPLEYRYLDFPEASQLRSLLSEEAFIAYLAKVEATLVRTFALRGLCSDDIAQAVSVAASQITAAEVYREEKRIHHQVRALVNCLAQKAGADAARWIHLGATSHDIICTAEALRFRDFSNLVLLPCLIELLRTLIAIARREKATVQIGRTHGQYAVPTTFGFTLCEYISRLGERIFKIRESAASLRGKFSGAVGSYNAQSILFQDPLAFEQEFLAQLGLQAAEHSTQITAPEYLLDLMHTSVSTFGVLANLADDMRHLQRSEIDEVGEAFSESQVGSSTMPHKRNPINFENVKSFYKTFMPRIITGYLDQISEHQRDLTNSASARFSGELLAGLYLAARRLDKTMKKLVVHHTALQRNLTAAKDKILAEPCYLILARHGCSDAHEQVRQCLQNENQDFWRLLECIPGVEISAAERHLLTHPKNYIGLAVARTEAICDLWESRITTDNKRE